MFDIVLTEFVDCFLQVILEGVLGNGIYGDIAVDDLSFLNEEDCQTIHGDGHKIISLFSISMFMVVRA